MFIHRGRSEVQKIKPRKTRRLGVGISTRCIEIVEENAMKLTEERVQEYQGDVVRSVCCIQLVCLFMICRNRKSDRVRRLSGQRCTLVQDAENVQAARVLPRSLCVSGPDLIRNHHRPIEFIVGAHPLQQRWGESSSRMPAQAPQSPSTSFVVSGPCYP